jgi:ABC-2 type transport system ATP-binding protein
MSTHILSDIEALCDNVAILRNGKLAATGNLNELLTNSGEKQSFEITVKGVSAESLKISLTELASAAFYSKPNGANINVSDEKDIEKVLQAARHAGGSLVSVQPVRQSLEELFVKETE